MGMLWRFVGRFQRLQVQGRDVDLRVGGVDEYRRLTEQSIKDFADGCELRRLVLASRKFIKGLQVLRQPRQIARPQFVDRGFWPTTRVCRVPRHHGPVGPAGN